MSPRPRPRPRTACGHCSMPTLHAICDACTAESLRSCLESPRWMDVRGSTPGTLPGETLADEFRRDLARVAELRR